jgi:hypothetical protein
MFEPSPDPRVDAAPGAVPRPVAAQPAQGPLANSYAISCPMVITSFTARPGGAPRTVILEWSISGGCPPFQGSLGAYYVQSSGRYWTNQITSGQNGTFTDRPPLPGPGSCIATVHYNLMFSGMAPDGRAPRAAMTEIDVSMC